MHEATMTALLSLLVTAGAAALSATAATTCTGLRTGYYCIDSSRYAWCFGREFPATGTCQTNLVCKCGFTTGNPCMWASSTPSSCDGHAGDYMKAADQGTATESSMGPGTGGSGDASVPIPVIPNAGVYAVYPTNHTSLVIKFDAQNWRAQLRDLIARQFYDDSSSYSPSANDYMCSFHPPPKYDSAPSQLWIGRPSATTTISYTPGVTVRLQDRFVGLFLGYAMDHYGLSPSMLLALAAKESFGPVVFKEQDNSFFIVDDPAAHFDCYATPKQGLCTDNNMDGPFQVETGGMSSDVAAFAQRFYTGDLSVPKNDRKPMYTTDNELMVLPGFRAFHDSFTKDLDRAVVLTALDFHFRHNILALMKSIGFVDALNRRTARKDRDSLEFATAMYTYNRGIFDTQLPGMLSKCGPTADPVACGLDGYGGHTANIRDACRLLDMAPALEVYDYSVTASDVAEFINTLEATYPYDSVPPFHGTIDWSAIRADAAEAFAVLQDHRTKTSGSTSGISFRYDWRALLAVVRMRLPPREALVGPSVENYVNYWGGRANKPMQPLQDPKSFPVPYCSVAGGVDGLCSNTTGTPDKPVDLCPDDPAKTAPGVCGCGIPESVGCGAAAAGCGVQCDQSFVNCSSRAVAKDTACQCLSTFAACKRTNGCASGIADALASCTQC